MTLATKSVPVSGSVSSSPAARPPRRGRWLRRLLALGVGLAIAWLLGELLVLAVFGTQVRFARHVVAAPWGLRYNDPGSSYWHHSGDGSWHFQINGQGMRDTREFAHAKPAGTKRIVSLGDSFTIGYEVNADQTFSAILERDLRAAGHTVEVMNAGVSGYSNAECCLYLERELLKYQPDVVVMNFFGNDLVDNVRSGLFRLEGDQLAEWNPNYVPAGRLADWLNRSAFFNFLSERSNLFVFGKERLTLLLKRDMVQENERNIDSAKDTKVDDETAYQRKLGAKIFERAYAKLRALGIPLVIHSIPTQFGPPDRPLTELFPLAEFPTERPGLLFVAGKPVLEPHVGKELLYRQRSHFHLTDVGHALLGKELARAVLASGCLTAKDAPAGQSGR